MMTGKKIEFAADDRVEFIVTQRGEEPFKTVLNQGRYVLGAADICDVVIPGTGVSKKHALVAIENGGITVEDLDSTNGTFVDGVRIKRPCQLRYGQKIGIGTCTITVRPAQAPKPKPPPVEETESDEADDFTEDEPLPAPPPREPPRRHAPPKREAAPARPPEVPVLRSPEEIAEQTLGGGDLAQKRSIKRQIHAELLRRLDLKRLAASGINETDLQEKVRHTVSAIIHDIRDKIPTHISLPMLAKDIVDEAIGLGPLEDLLADPEVTEIMVNGYDRIYVEREGKIKLTERTFVDNDQVLAIISRIVDRIGRRIDESSPMVDARLKDGSRVNAIIHPLSLKGPTLTIRKFSKTPFTVQDLIRFNTFTPQMAEFFKVCVLLRKNIIISGGTGSGKTTLLNVFSSFLPANERIITIEDAAELRLNQDHVVSLESRPPNIEGKGAIVIRDLVRNALRMRPDRIVVGECRGGEALDMLQAMNTGHDGSLTTVHANSPRDVISRLETMVMMSGMDLPSRAIREQIASAIDLIVHVDRMSDGTRKVVKVTEVTGIERDTITLQDIFEFKQTGIDPQGKVLGYFTATGVIPSFIDEVETRGLSLPREVFAEHNPAGARRPQNQYGF
jgi:pilus assembly protein CpaF